MCIISFYRDREQLILTHNRDEEIKRVASTGIEERTMFGKNFSAPIDQRANGTWIFSSETFLACALNGGRGATVHKSGNYRLSRGIVLLHLLKYDSVEDFIKSENLADIAPFTFFVYDRLAARSYKLFWDEVELTVKDYGTVNFVSHSSTTLYTSEQAAYNTEQLKSGEEWTAEQVLKKHYDLKMEDGQVVAGLATTSITQIIVKDQDRKMKYCQLY